MSHTTSEPKICPNCGYPAVENFCAQCGQETHLHKDTFGALIMHFAGHYLHYDSKFWQTLKALWFSPGLLTTAYWEEKRMRYIPPISLYIFVSFIYFFIGSVLPKDEKKAPPTPAAKTYDLGKGAKLTVNKELPQNVGGIQYNVSNTEDTLRKIDVNVQEAKIFGWDISKAWKKRPDMKEYIGEQMKHLYPKIFFFLIPFMALILKLLFIRRKDLYYVNHVIFSLHYHAFYFSLKTLNELYVFPHGSVLVTMICAVFYVIYMVKSMHNVYGISRWRSFFYGTVIGFFYGLFFTLVGSAMFLYAIWCA